MANKILVRRGLAGDMPTLSAGEPGFALDTKQMFMGTENGNICLTGTRWYIGRKIVGMDDVDYSDATCPEMKLGDIYFCQYYGYFYECVTPGKGADAKFRYRGSLRGSTGLTGATGPQGEKGEKGDKGDDMQAVYSSTPTKIGEWIDGSDIKRVAWTFSATSKALYQFCDIPSNPVSDEKKVLRCGFSCYYDDFSHIACDLEALVTMLADSGASGKTVYCFMEYID